MLWGLCSQQKASSPVCGLWMYKGASHFVVGQESRIVKSLGKIESYPRTCIIHHFFSAVTFKCMEYHNATETEEQVPYSSFYRKGGSSGQLLWVAAHRRHHPASYNWEERYRRPVLCSLGSCQGRRVWSDGFTGVGKGSFHDTISRRNQ